MELFRRARLVRLKSNHGKFLYADEDEESVKQHRNASSKNVKWTVEFVRDDGLRLKSCYNRYLTASNEPFLLGMTGRKVLQTTPTRMDSSVEWVPQRDGFLVKIMTRYGNFLRANGGLPPWRNSITHDVPQRTVTQDWILWEVEILDFVLESHTKPLEPIKPRYDPPLKPDETTQPKRGSSLNALASSVKSYDPPSPKRNSSMKTPIQDVDVPEPESPKLFPPKSEGRTINFLIADDNGNAEENLFSDRFIFNGTSLQELIQKLEERTGIDDPIVCSRIAGRLIRLHLELPPNNASMNIILVRPSSKLARSLQAVQ